MYQSTSTKQSLKLSPSDMTAHGAPKPDLQKIGTSFNLSETPTPAFSGAKDSRGSRQLIGTGIDLSQSRTMPYGGQIQISDRAKVNKLEKY